MVGPHVMRMRRQAHGLQHLHRPVERRTAHEPAHQRVGQGDGGHEREREGQAEQSGDGAHAALARI
ncbi:MAG: hypothetical protein O7I93_02250, partial [Gemmatimonadetes bacterium]|nr:hypothetical protein [Gemmatimonadota bacterium]